MKTSIKLQLELYLFIVFILTFAFGFNSTANAQYTTLHKFVDSSGTLPYGDLTFFDGKFYGMTTHGGTGLFGVIFSITLDGSNYTNIHNFTGDSGSGRVPEGNLICSGSNLYGMAVYGGADGEGVIFKINADGSNYTNLHEFVGGNNDGARPDGSLKLAAGIFYGMTANGGSVNKGVIFKMDIDGNNYTNIHEFSGADDNGEYPRDNVILLGNTLYGMTGSGGSAGRGVVFKINTDGSEYTNLHNFAGDDGGGPVGSLILYSTNLYGMTSGGGIFGRGVIFRIGLMGRDYTNLHDFSDNIYNGKYPYGDLNLSFNTFCGMTYGGGTDGDGVIFEMDIDGKNYINIHDFSRTVDNGRQPFGSLLILDDSYYGMTAYGGDNQGVIFKYTIPEPFTFLIFQFLIFVYYWRRK